MGAEVKTREQLAGEVADLRRWAELWRRITQIFLTVSDEDMYAEVLAVVLEATESKYGFFGYIDGEGALACPSMTGDIGHNRRMADKPVVFPRETWGGIWGRALVEKKALYSNAPCDVPEGHMPVLRALAVPIVHRGQVIGLLHVANKPTDYDEPDVRLLEDVAGHVGAVLKARLQRDLQEADRKQAQEQSQASEARYRHLFEHLSDAAFLVRAESGVIVETNRKGEELLGRSREEIIGMRQSELHPADQRAECRRLFDEFLAAGDTSGVEAEVLTKYGRAVPVQISVTTTTLGGERLALSLFRDISHLKRAEQTLRNSEIFTRAVMDSLPIGIAVSSVDPPVTFEYMNDNFARFYRTPREALVDPYAFWDAVYEDPRFREEIKKRILDDCASGDPARMHWEDVPITRKGQPTTFISARNIPIPDKHLMISTVWDVTERKRAEEALRESEMMNRSLLEGSPVCNKIIDMDSKLRYMSSAGIKQLKIPDITPYYGQTYPPDFYPESMRAPLVKGLNLAMAGEISSVEAPLHDMEGTEVWYHTTFVPALDDDGRVKYVIGTSVNITERKRAEEERISLERQVQHAQKLESLGVLAGGIAHDFNNLLAVVVGNADMALRDLSEPSPARSSVEEIKKAGLRASRLTNQMLAYSGKGRFVVKPLDLNDLIGEMGSLLQASIPKKIAVQYDLATDLPAIEADVAQMQQVVMNLMTNAAEAIGDEKGIVTVSTGMIEADRACLARMDLADGLPEGSYVYLEVSDTGHGMDEQTKSKLFEPFFTTKFTGRGLGMAAVLGIVRSHHGAIRVDSEVGKGATFRLLFPPSTEAAVPTTAPVDGGAEEVPPGGGTILVVDDEPRVRAVAERMLQQAGFDVLTACDGQEAVAVFGEHADQVSAVLLDLTMPEMGGEEAFEGLRRIRQDVPVLLCSGYAEDDATSRFEGKGPAGFIHKPFEFDEMIAKIREVLHG